MATFLDVFFSTLSHPVFTDADWGFLQTEIPRIKRRYDQWHRHYHTWDHVNALLSLLEETVSHSRIQDILGDILQTDCTHNFKNKDEVFGALAIAILYHDVVYNPLNKESEALSVQFFKNSIKRLHGMDSFIVKFAPQICSAILETEVFQKERWTKLGSTLRELDQYTLIRPSQNHNQFIIEEQIRKEYNHLPFSEFIAGRKKFSFQWKDRFGSSISNNFDTTWHYAEFREEVQKEKIGFFFLSDSFLHLGYWSVIQTALKVFDRVVIGVGERHNHFSDSVSDIRHRLPFIDVRHAHDFDKALKQLREEGDVTLIKAIPNTHVFELEQNMFDNAHTCLDESDIMPTVFVPVEQEYRHIDSRTLSFALRHGKSIEHFVPSLKDLGYTQEELDEMLLGNATMEDLQQS